VFQKFVFIFALISCLSVAHLAVAQATNNDKPLTGSDLKDATQMNDMYARHMYSSTCVEKVKAYDTTIAATPADDAKKMAQFKKSCDCLTDAMLKSFTPNDLIGYVSDMQGAIPPGAKARATPTQATIEKYGKIEVMNSQIEASRQCGFKQ
jgi:hypothetical protein